MDIYAQVASRIIKEQQSIVGPLALEQAKKVEGLTFNGLEDIKIQGDGKVVLGHLVSQYEKLFGQTSIEVCKEALQPIQDKLTSTDLPDVLKS